ncbi:SGNH/GDSL hydrolase family protein [Cohnella herbarum]|uniref:SGNH/GDSL hydrolase family protein n=1 Tax=Cohnella herbarum TaxID=2728023 RepID=A0A7Z2ZQ30_9BACL|nr:SGNH/GDSL hydrolase family protein [Cohnella herbarum]QJD86602.1 SGNH/GDSL hydrolase family protein [Cohnella herbarum]
MKEKLAGNGRVVVAYIGGSITEGAGASDADATSWRALTDRFLKERYTEERIASINAGVGGTNSTFGAHRLQEHVFSQGEIDLLFVEFSVNDGDDREESIRGMEGIVRQCRTIFPKTDVCFVYAAADKNLSEGLPFNIAIHEEVAIHYDIPSINLAAKIRQREYAGEGSWGELANDRTHPNDAGHALYADDIRGMLEFVLGDDEPREGGEVHFDVTLPKPLLKTNYEHAAMLGLGTASELNGFAFTETYPGPMMNWRYKIDHLRADSPEASLTFSVTGRSAGLLLLCGPDTGSFEYSVNGNTFNKVNLFDEWCLLAYRPIIALFPLQEETTEIQITIRNTAIKDERSTGNGLRIMRLLRN